MAHISIVKSKNLYISGVINVLKESMSEHIFELYHYHGRNIFAKKPFYNSDLLIIEIAPEIDVYRIVNKVKDSKVKIAVWANSKISRNSLINYMKLNVDGYFYYQMELEELSTALKMILNNDKYIHPYFSSIILEEYLNAINRNSTRPTGLLTSREWEVLEKMGSGCKNEEIAERLQISNKTVNNHVSSILNKLRVKDRTSAVVKAIKNNWIDV